MFWGEEWVTMGGRDSLARVEVGTAGSGWGSLSGSRRSLGTGTLELGWGSGGGRSSEWRWGWFCRRSVDKSEFRMSSPMNSRKLRSSWSSLAFRSESIVAVVKKGVAMQLFIGMLRPRGYL